MQISQQNSLAAVSAIARQGGFAFDVCFWLYFLKKDSERYKNPELFPKTHGILASQRKTVIATKIVADCLRLFDVVGRKFPLSFNQQAVKIARIGGLLFGAVDGWDEQIFSYNQLKKEFTVQNTANFLSHVFFNAFSVASIASAIKPLQGNARPVILLGWMATCIVSSIIAKNFTKKTN
jgi:hypothetical protein